MNKSFIDVVRDAAWKRILFLPHAIRQMSHPERMISTRDVRSVLHSGEIIEDYPEDSRGHSCLILGRDSAGRAIHVVCAPKDDFLAIITAYLPNPAQWDSTFKQRR